MPSSAECSMRCGNSGSRKDTLVVFASDNGPQGEVVRQFAGDMPRDGLAWPLPRRTRRCQRRLHPHCRTDPLAGSDCAAIFLRDVAMFSIMDFFPTLVRLAGGKVPDYRPIDGVDQTDLLLGRSDTGVKHC
jgi:arylsulfatase A-like enzyme